MSNRIEEITALLRQGGYLDAVNLIADLQATVSRRAEFDYLKQFIRESSFNVDILRDQLRMLWTAYCLHHRLDVDTSGYDKDLLELWNDMEDEPETADWSEYDEFDNYMCRYLV